MAAGRALGVSLAVHGGAVALLALGLARPPERPRTEPVPVEVEVVAVPAAAAGGAAAAATSAPAAVPAGRARGSVAGKGVAAWGLRPTETEPEAGPGPE